MSTHPSTGNGWSGSLENSPLSDMCTLATPSPSERVNVSPDFSSTYFHALPKPALSNGYCEEIDGGPRLLVGIWYIGWMRSPCREEGPTRSILASI
jgi:hypothetical protein